MIIIGVLLIQAKRIEAKERIQVGIGLVAIKKTVKPNKLHSLFTSLIRIELTHPPPEGGALSTELQGHLLI